MEVIGYGILLDLEEKNLIWKSLINALILKSNKWISYRFHNQVSRLLKMNQIDLQEL